MDASQNNPTKSKAILALLGRINELFPRNYFITVDHWEADLDAIGIARSDDRDRLIYISTFSKKPGRYYFECEPINKGASYNTASEDASFEELLYTLEKHLIP